MGLTHTFKNMFGGYTQAQKLVRDATADNSSKSEPYIMRQLAKTTKNPKHVKPIMKVLYQRMNDKGKHWRHVEKALDLLLYLLSYGGNGVVEWYLDNTYLVQSLCTYHQNGEDGNDIAGRIRHLATEVVALVQDKSRLEKSRIEAAKDLEAQNKEAIEAYKRYAQVMVTVNTTQTYLAIASAAAI